MACLCIELEAKCCCCSESVTENSPPRHEKGIWQGLAFWGESPPGSPENRTLDCLEAAGAGCPVPSATPSLTVVLGLTVAADCSVYREISQNLSLLWVGADIKPIWFMPCHGQGHLPLAHPDPEHSQGGSGGCSWFC